MFITPSLNIVKVIILNLSSERMTRITLLVVSVLIFSASSEPYEDARYSGLKVPEESDRSNSPAMEEYLSSLRTSSVPDSFDAREEGWVGPPKHQRSCGSCVVFTNVGLIETCIARTLCTERPAQCRVPDLSEQEALQCGYNPPDVTGCNGAVPDAYVKWIIERGGYMAEELEFPYDPEKLTQQCPDLQDDQPGVVITGEDVAYHVDEETLKSKYLLGPSFLLPLTCRTCLLEWCRPVLHLRSGRELQGVQGRDIRELLL